MPLAQAIVTFTDTPDLAAAQTALDLIEQANSSPALVDALDALAAALCFKHYALLQYLPGELGHARAFHNLAPSTDLSAIGRSVVMANLLTTPMPQGLPQDLDNPEFQHGVGVSSPYSAIACALLLGAASPAGSDRALADQQGIGLVAIGQLASALQRVERAECPLTERELQCLRFAVIGMSAKETARELGISHRTVQEYIERSRSRLGAATTIAATMTAIKRGWITDDEIAALGFSSRRQSGAG